LIESYFPRCAVVIYVFNSQFEEEKGNMFGVGASLEESCCALVIGDFIII
jgi:hypothetical protein